MKDKRRNWKLSNQTANRLATLQQDLEAICEKKLSQDKVAQILLCVKSIEEQVIHLTIEMGLPSETKKRRNQLEQKNRPIEKTC